MVRIATYNVENLFSRPVLFNWQDHDAAKEKLKLISDLTALLDKPSYSAADRKQINKLHKEVKDYIVLNVRSSKAGRYIFTSTGLSPKVDGRDEWDGFIDLKRERFDDDTVKFTAKVINAVDPDILCMVEVESAPTLQMFSSQRLNPTLTDRIVIDGNDPRGIDIALGARKGFPIVTAKTNIFARDDEGVIFSRDCLEVEVGVGKKKTVHLLVNHFKAKDASPEKSDAKRLRQAKKVSEILKTRYDLTKDYVVVAGDLNDTPGSKPLAPLEKTKGLHNVLDVMKHPADDRWTYTYQKQKNAIDYLFVSEALAAKVTGVGFERRGMYDLETLTKNTLHPQKSFPGLDNWKLAGSDHALVYFDADI